MKLELVKNRPEFYEFMRLLRNHDEVQAGFIEWVNVTPEQQQVYMQKYADHYWIALCDGQPAGYIGEIDGDIRIATHPDHQRKGVASFMLSEFVSRFPQVFAKVKVDNEASLRLFRKAGFQDRFLILYPPNTPDAPR